MNTALETHPASSIAYLGPKGTYSQAAALLFAESLGMPQAKLVAQQSFSAVFDAVEDGLAEYGVVALENSIEGPVTATLDAFAARNTCVILAELILNIEHCLLAHPDAQTENLEVIASHPQALAQCRSFIEANYPGCRTQAASSTGEAAQLAMQDLRLGAIASEHAAKICGAKVVHANIADHVGDQTSFALIAKQGHAPLPADGAPMKTSLALYLHADRPGALQMILSEFAYADINLTRIQSRPTKERLGEYMFFLDAEGSLDDPQMKTALECLRMKLREVKVIGSYPAPRKSS